MNIVVPDGMILKIGTLDLLRETYRIYCEHCWRFFRLTLPAALISFVGSVILDSWRAQIARDLDVQSEAQMWLDGRRFEVLFRLFKLTGVNLSRLYFSWLLFALAMGACAIAVGALRRQQVLERYETEYTRPRQRLSAVALAALITFAWAVVATVLISVVGIASLRFVPAAHATSAIWTVNLLMWLPVLFLMTRYALVIPVLMREDCGVRDAMRRSARLSEGNEFFLLLVTLESLISSWLAVQLAYFAVPWVFRVAHMPDGWWIPWLLAILAAIAGASVQPVMSVGFAVLYEELRSPNAEPVPIS